VPRSPMNVLQQTDSPRLSPSLMNPPMITLTVGGLVILLALVTPSSGFLHFLVARPGDRVNELVLGITLFKYSLVTFGLFLIALGRLPIWQPVTPVEKPLTDPRHHSLSLVILMAILCAATVLRLHALGSGLWYDEILTYVHYARLPFGEIITTYDDQNQHFLYSVLAHASFLSFGESGWSLRLPAVLFGVGSIWALFLLGREVADTREALLSAALLTFSYHHIWFSQNARGYIGLLFWTILASWLLLRAMQETRPQLWVLYAVAVALGAYTHVTMIFIVAGHFIIYLITLSNRRHERWPHRWSGLFLGFCLGGFLTIVFFSLVLPQLLGGTFSQGAVKSAAVTVWKNPLWTVSEFIRASKVDLGRSILAVLAFSVFGVGLWSFIHTRRVVIALLIIPTFICAATTLWMGHPLWPRLFFFNSGLVALVVVRGVMQFARAATRSLDLAPTKAAPIGSALCIGLLLTSAVSSIKAYAPKQDYLGALNYIQQNYHPGDAIVTVGVMVTFPYKNLYKTDWKAIDTVEDLQFIRARSKRLWLLYTMPVYLEQAYPEIMTAIRKDFVVVKQFYGTLGGGTIVICRSDLPTGGIE
jgi:mannosyltransferase